MVPEYLTPSNGATLSPAQLVTLCRAALPPGRAAPGVTELHLSLTTHVAVGRVRNGNRCQWQWGWCGFVCVSVSAA